VRAVSGMVKKSREEGTFVRGPAQGKPKLVVRPRASPSSGSIWEPVARQISEPPLTQGWARNYGATKHLEKIGVGKLPIVCGRLGRQRPPFLL